MTNWLFVERKPKKAAEAKPVDATIDWESILYYGDRRLARDLRRRGDRRRKVGKR
ncbi:hypothetical protein [Aeromicrobium sp. UC242_57]|uniref:hypothetical protein n=1 Tax=Aeromicrobium sp. UC242_57 TaxID=3374624 RepID=UPI0037B63F26